MPALQAELHAAIQRTAARHDGPFKAGVHAAGLLGRLVQVDEPEAVRLARGLLQTHLGRNVVVWLGGVVSEGRGEESLLLADELKQAGRTLGIDPQVDEALGSRQRMVAREAR